MDAKNYWNNRYIAGRDSGYGSYGKQLEKKLDWLKGLDINSITEIGCGDFNFGSELLKLYPKARYTGYDIAPAIIHKNQLLFPQHVFTTDFNLPRADLLLCVDVLFHVLDDKELETLLNDIEAGWTDYLAITAYERDEEMEGHVRIRRFDYKRFGEPIIREIVEEDGQLYFYLFKKQGIDLRKVSCILNTKESTYPEEIINQITKFPFGEILINTHADSPFRKYELIDKTRGDFIYYQDDDAIIPIDELLKQSKPDIINVGMKPGHVEAYKDREITMGLGWGCIVPKQKFLSLQKYIDKYGQDEVFERETERILTGLNFPQNRISLDVVDLPSATEPGRLWKDPKHHEFALIAEKRCKELTS